MEVSKKMEVSKINFSLEHILSRRDNSHKLRAVS